MDSLPGGEGYFWEMVDEMPLGDSIPFEGAEEEEDRVYQTLFAAQALWMGVSVNPRLVLKMRIKKREVQWSDLQFESKSQSSQPYEAWMQKVLAIPWFYRSCLQRHLRRPYPALPYCRSRGII